MIDTPILRELPLIFEMVRSDLAQAMRRGPPAPQSSERFPTVASSHASGIEPIPPFTVSAGVHNGFTAVAALALLGVAVWAAWVVSRRRTAVPLFFLVGGALTVGFEPIVDTLGKCFLPSDYQWTLFTVLGRPMPVYAILVYAAFFGGFATMAWNHLTAGGAPRGLWKWYGAAILINTFLFESIAVPIFGVYTYYGHQPFNFWGFPLWWPFVNTAGPILAGSLVYLANKYLNVRPAALAAISVVVVPMTDGAVNAASAYPTWLALNSDVAPWVTWCAGALTIGLAILIMRGIIGSLEIIQARSGHGVIEDPNGAVRQAHRLPADVAAAANPAAR